MKQKIFVTSMAVLTACIVLGLIFSRHVLPVSADDGVTIFDVSSDYLTPQQFKAVGDGEHDDTEAFRQLFAAAYDQAYQISGGLYHCKAIYIPSGNYPKQCFGIRCGNLPLQNQCPMFSQWLQFRISLLFPALSTHFFDVRLWERARKDPR